MPFDVPTLFAVMVAVSAVYALVVALIAHQRQPDMYIWAAALSLQTLGCIFFALRGHIAEAVSVLAANAALGSALALYCEGVLRFRQIRWPRWWVWGPAVVVVVAMALLLEGFHTRAVVASSIYGGQYLLVVVAVMHRRVTPLQRGEQLIVWGAGAVGVTLLFRAWVMAAGWVAVPSLTHPGWLQGLTFLAMILSTALLGLGLVIMYQDRTEATLQAGEQHQVFRNRILELLSRGQPLPDLLREIVHGVEEMHPSTLCSVVLLDRQGATLTVGAAPSLPVFFNEAVEGLPVGHGVGSCGTAAFSGQRVVVEDIENHPYWAPYVDVTRQAGLRSCWSQPIFSSEQKVLGTFAIYGRAPHAPGERDIALMEELAVLTGIAIERSTAVAQLQERERHYRLVIETANEGIAVLQDGVVRFGNPKLFEMLGYTEDELIDQPFDRLVHDEDRERAVEQYRMRMEGGPAPPHQTFRVLTAHLGVRWFQVSGARFEWQEQPATLTFMTDVTERHEMEERIQQQALHDTLTELPNRRLLMNNLNMAMAAHKRNGLFGALMFLDLDNFKPLNDEHGHRVGDLLLQEVARRLKAQIRETDTVARFGGDEFVVLLSDLHHELPTSVDLAKAVADKLRLALSEAYVLNVAHEHAPPRTVEHRCSASIGMVMFNGGQEGPDDLIKRADMAMYAAKQAGRNTVHLAS